MITHDEIQEKLEADHQAFLAKNPNLVTERDRFVILLTQAEIDLQDALNLIEMMPVPESPILKERRDKILRAYGVDT